MYISKHIGSREILEIASYQAEGWHKARASLGTSVQIRSAHSLWSMGSVDLSEVGRSVIHLPKREVCLFEYMCICIHIRIFIPRYLSRCM
jgi:hypothetical protein